MLDRLNIEPGIDQSEPNRGYWADYTFIRPDDFHQNGTPYVRMPLATGAVPFLERVQSPFMGVRWDNAAGTASIGCELKLPGEYDASVDQLQLIPTIRYSGAGAAAADLAMTIAANYFQPGYAAGNIAGTVTPTIALGTLVAGDTAIQQVVAAGSQATRELGGFAAAAVAGFYDYTFDFSFGVEGKTVAGTNNVNKFKPLTMLNLTLAPSAAAGANNNIDLLGVLVRIKRSATLNNYSARRYPVAGSLRPR